MACIWELESCFGDPTLLTAKVDVNGIADIKLYEALKDINTVATM